MSISNDNPYPAQTGPYRVVVKGGGGRWKDFDTVRLEISVGGENHEGEKFAATVEWVRRRFSRSIVCVNDTLQRFNRMFEDGLSEDEARAHCAEEGRAWVRRNHAALRRLPGMELHHWDDWMAAPGFAAVNGLTDRLRGVVPALDAAIAADIDDMWRRRQRRMPGLYADHRRAEFSALADRYIAEEIDRFAVILPRDQAVDLYPGSILRVWQLMDGVSLPGTACLTGGTFTRIDFRRREPHRPTPLSRDWDHMRRDAAGCSTGRDTERRSTSALVDRTGCLSDDPALTLR